MTTSEISKRPVQLFIPELDYPKPLAKIIASHQAAQEAWRTAYAAVVAADAVLTRAPADDRAALVQAVQAGQEYPGHANEQSARAALEVAEEKCRVAREAATAQTDIVKAALAAAVDELVPLVVESIKLAAEAHEVTLEQCKAMEDASRANLHNALAAMRLVAPHIANRYGLSVDWSGIGVAQPTWPAHPITALRDRVDRLERVISEAPAARLSATSA